jgi:peptidoglycan hydrolase CwlO-like protein
MENGFTLSVEKDGIIASLEEVSDEVEEEVETEEEEKEMGYVSRDEFEMALQEIKKMIDDLRPEEEEVEEEVKEEEVEEELSETAELKAELSKPASAPIKHNPEASTEKTRNFKFAQNRKKTTFDLVLEKISKIKN